MKFRIMPIAALLLLPLGAYASPLLQVAESGHLTGAHGVVVGESVYDVQFMDGTCAELYDGCDEASDFIFQTSEAANAASLALIAQVFVDSALGLFDSEPGQILGCPGPATVLGSCLAITPYTSTLVTGQNGNQAFARLAVNGPQQFNDHANASGGFHLDLFHTGDCGPQQYCPPSWAPWAMWAVWTPRVAVPETGMLLLLAAGLPGILLARRRRR